MKSQSAGLEGTADNGFVQRDVRGIDDMVKLLRCGPSMGIG